MEKQLGEKKKTLDWKKNKQSKVQKQVSTTSLQSQKTDEYNSKSGKHFQ